MYKLEVDLVPRVKLWHVLIRSRRWKKHSTRTHKTKSKWRKQTKAQKKWNSARTAKRIDQSPKAALVLDARALRRNNIVYDYDVMQRNGDRLGIFIVVGGVENWSCLVQPGRNSCLHEKSKLFVAILQNFFRYYYFWSIGNAKLLRMRSI